MSLDSLLDILTPCIAAALLFQSFDFLERFSRLLAHSFTTVRLMNLNRFFIEKMRGAVVVTRLFLLFSRMSLKS